MLNLATHNINSSPVLKRPSARLIASPFGSSLPSRAWSDVSKGYRFGFNGKEKDSETANDAYDFGARIYDGRLGRWLSVDPLTNKYPDINPYAISLNCPFYLKDPDGRLVVVATGNLSFFFVCYGISVNGGLAIGNDGVAFVRGGDVQVGVGIEGSLSFNVTIFPTMKSVDNLNGLGYSLSASGAFLGKFGVGVQYSSGYYGLSTSYGGGFGVRSSVGLSGTAINKVTWEELGNYFNGDNVNGLAANLPISMRLKMKQGIVDNLNARWTTLNNQIIETNKKIVSNNDIIKKYNSANNKDKKNMLKQFNKAILSNRVLFKKNQESVNERNEIDEIKKKIK